MPLEGVRFLLRPGHTPGHSVIQLSFDGKSVFVLGDVWFSQPDQLRNPEWVRPIETDGLKGFQSRLSVMSNLSMSGDLAIVFHEDFPGIGRIVKTVLGYDWVTTRLPQLGIARRKC